MADLRLRHVIVTADTRLYFYDGELPVVGGVITIPSGRPEWGAAAWIRGYRVDADTGEQLAPHVIQERLLASEPIEVVPVSEPVAEVARKRRATRARRATTTTRRSRKTT